ncbi:hypothetical protein CONPUDRAFT_64644 [Coniophora puteana RWD-64-598 SS2]|uniref:Uncharacterized protein n=1 Tax=Coniophora puteana (strain RWD-64-598) TaxID=741705 RepID=A0A5M3MB18_CONPW|nr:uncharacterized protein CONPUDRAFT_64644 [Coniophora puteana RWD-64-598 SS2]EIW76458.1 hypothetical protein CONPUDRAFT_64644 [Coniophora puteana RWD-64-598 SS2]
MASIPTPSYSPPPSYDSICGNQSITEPTYEHVHDHALSGPSETVRQASRTSELWSYTSEGVHLQLGHPFNDTASDLVSTIDFVLPAINGKTPSPLVRQEHLKGHLSLLRAFNALRASIEEGSVVNIPGLVLEMRPDAWWGWFVNLAVERFERWCLSLEDNDDVLDNLPPIDVVMVWHTYLLNPK